MAQDFTRYTEASVTALTFNPKSQEVIERKQEILKSIAQHYNSTPANVLFYGFSPLIQASSFKQISVTAISDPIKKYLTDLGIKYTYIDKDDLGQYTKQFDWVVAVDEYFTFVSSESEQLANIQKLSNLARTAIVTTLRDYKNQDFKDREFSQPLAIRRGKDSRLFVEYHDHDYADRNVWKTTLYELEGANCITYGPYNRRNMFFKQMAKFSIDAGAKEFYVHKNLMYKSLIKKNYEHVISISF
jgi:hypothetical protein